MTRVSAAAPVALVLVLVLGGAAVAAPLVKAPDGWKGGASDDLIHATGMLPHFGGVHGIIEAERYDGPKPGIVLYVSRVAATVAARDPAARAEIDLQHPSPVSSQRETEWQERFDPGSKLADVRLDYRDSSSKLGGRVHLVLAATGDRLVAAKGECLVADDADPELVQACYAALDSVDTGVEPKDRVALDLDAKPAEPATPLATTETPHHVPLPPIAVPHEEPRTDLRPIIVGAGIVALAFGFWWNRKRRDRYTSESQKEHPADER
jgi:hypothetical protein